MTAQSHETFYDRCAVTNLIIDASQETSQVWRALQVLLSAACRYAFVYWLNTCQANDLDFYAEP
jgi:hypothetical protein